MYIHAEHDTIDTVNISKVSGKDEPDAAVIAGDRETVQHQLMEKNVYRLCVCNGSLQANDSLCTYY